MDPNALFSNQIRSQLETLFLQREDGDWDYYPFGFAKPGYRVDSALRQNLLSEPVFPTRSFLVAIPMIVVGTWFIHSFENKLLFAAVIGLLFIVLYQIYRRGRLKIILRNSPEVRALSKAERRRPKSSVLGRGH